MSIFYVPDTVVTGAEDGGVEVVVDEVALLEASSCRTAKDTLALRSSRDTVTVPELPPAADVVGGVAVGGNDPAEDIKELDTGWQPQPTARNYFSAHARAIP